MEALRLGSAADGGPGIGIPLFQLGLLALFEGNLAQAEALLSDSLLALQERRDSYRASHLLFALGFVALGQDQLEQAHSYFVESLAVASRRGDVWATALIVEGIACLLAQQGDAERALRLAGAAQALRERHHVRISIQAFGQLRDHLLSPAWTALASQAPATWTAGQSVSLEHLLTEDLTVVDLKKGVLVVNQPLSSEPLRDAGM